MKDGKEDADFGMCTVFGYDAPLSPILGFVAVVASQLKRVM
jgi:hypothetical protein